MVFDLSLQASASAAELLELGDSMSRRVLPFKEPLLDPSWLPFHRFSWISNNFFRFHEFPWIWGFQPVGAFADGMMPLKKPLLGPSWLLFHGFSQISEDFIRFHGFP